MQHLLCRWASLVAQLVKNLPATRGTWVRSLGWEDPLEKGPATHCSILAWRTPWTVQSLGSQRVRHDWATFTTAMQIPKHWNKMDVVTLSLLLRRFHSAETKWTWSHPHLYYCVDSTVLKPNECGHTPISAFLPPAHLPWPHLNSVLMSRMNFLQNMSQLL